MLNILKIYKQVIIRVLGAMMLLVAFIVHFWATPKEGAAVNDVASANVARMEASIAGNSPAKQKKPDASPFMEEYQKTKQKQIEYLTILVMIVGAAFFLYSFIKEKELKS